MLGADLEKEQQHLLFLKAVVRFCSVKASWSVQGQCLKLYELPEEAEKTSEDVFCARPLLTHLCFNSLPFCTYLRNETLRN